MKKQDNTAASSGKPTRPEAPASPPTPASEPPRYRGFVRVARTGNRAKLPRGRWKPAKTGLPYYGEKLTPKLIEDHLAAGGAIAAVPHEWSAVCVDTDVEAHEWEEVEARLGLASLPIEACWATYRSQGDSGGRHRWYAVDRPLSLTDGKKKGLFLPGRVKPQKPRVADILAPSAYAILWAVESLADLEAWITARADASPMDPAPIEAALEAHGREPDKVEASPPPPSPSPSEGLRTATQGGGREANAEATLAIYEDGLREIATAAQGTRNERLNNHAYWCGRRLADPALPSRSRIETALISAAQIAGLAQGEARSTIASGLNAGEANPRPEAEPQESVDARAWEALTASLPPRSPANPSANPTPSAPIPADARVDVPTLSRLVLAHQRETLAVVTPHHGETSVLIALPNGTWSDSPDRLQHAINATIDALYARMRGVENPRVRKDALKKAERFATLADRHGKKKIAHNMPTQEAKYAFHEEALDAGKQHLATEAGAVSLIDHDPPLTGTDALPLAITRTLPRGFEPGASHPAVDGLTAHLDPQIAAYLWAELGFSLHRMPARRMLLFVGPPAAGKTHLIRALLATLGPLASRAGADLLKASQGNPGAPTTHLLPMVGGRVFAAMDEPPRGRIDSERLKELTGAGGIAYRTPYATQQVDHDITATLIVGANHGALPHMGLEAAAVRARVRVIPFPELPKRKRMGPGEAEALYGNPDFQRALLGRLIEEARACVVGGSITKPSPPPAVETALKDVIEEQGGPAYEVAQRLEREKGRFLPTAAQWEAQLQLDPSMSEKGKGARTRAFVGFARQRFPDFPRRQTTARIDGRPTKGWSNFRLADPEASREEATTPTATPHPEWATEALAALNAH